MFLEKITIISVDVEPEPWPVQFFKENKPSCREGGIRKKMYVNLSVFLQNYYKIFLIYV